MAEEDNEFVLTPPPVPVTAQRHMFTPDSRKALLREVVRLQPYKNPLLWDAVTNKYGWWCYKNISPARKTVPKDRLRKKVKLIIAKFGGELKNEDVGEEGGPYDSETLGLIEEVVKQFTESVELGQVRRNSRPNNKREYSPTTDTRFRIVPAEDANVRNGLLEHVNKRVRLSEGLAENGDFTETVASAASATILQKIPELIEAIHTSNTGNNKLDNESLRELGASFGASFAKSFSTSFETSVNKIINQVFDRISIKEPKAEPTDDVKDDEPSELEIPETIVAKSPEPEIETEEKDDIAEAAVAVVQNS
ncbi:hypothetical protein D0Z00_001408 [Geotrichum galactomycetum]|uniref:Uncharacterized protein n=1 Tax=Geotrichum galactomycetum TaxID=27317 RepID=A0ACB6V726_9ASCO|nr:hypothetical protein D0Z00_001408 [Geotrichum candidum]